jgi:hypothetical protein
MKRVLAATAAVAFLSLHAAAQTSAPDAVVERTAEARRLALQCQPPDSAMSTGRGGTGR